jgi:hypothetical protein
MKREILSQVSVSFPETCGEAKASQALKDLDTGKVGPKALINSRRGRVTQGRS